MPDDRIPAGLYDQDFAAWAFSQAAALRAAGEALGRGDKHATDLLAALDWDNLAEEIEGLARRDRREIGSRLAVIIEHLAKLEFSPASAPRAGWAATVRRERRAIEAILRDSPSLQRALPQLLAECCDDAVQEAAEAVMAFHETGAASACLGRLGTGYTLDEVLGAWLPETPAGASLPADTAEREGTADR
jgi:hypothetical protein